MSDSMDDVFLPELGPADHVWGPADAPLTVVEYGDFECPYCVEAFPVVERLRREYDGRLHLAFRNFPLRTSHPHAEAAAEASEFAAAHGRFWDMWALLYERSPQLDVQDLAGYAASLGLNPDELRSALEAHTYQPAVDASLASGERAGVEGTPWFFINGQPLEGAPTHAAFVAEFTRLLS